MSSPGKVQLNLRVSPALRDACKQAGANEGLSLNLWAEGVLEQAVGRARTDRLVAEAPPLIPGQTSIVEELEPAVVPSSSDDTDGTGCPECGGEMQAFALEDPPRMTTRCEDCGFWGDGG